MQKERACRLFVYKANLVSKGRNKSCVDNLWIMQPDVRRQKGKVVLVICLPANEASDLEEELAMVICMKG